MLTAQKSSRTRRRVEARDKSDRPKTIKKLISLTGYDDAYIRSLLDKGLFSSYSEAVRFIVKNQAMIQESVSKAKRVLQSAGT